MIARIWHGSTHPQNANVYEALLKTEIFPGILARSIAGFRRIELLRAPAGEEVEFVTDVVRSARRRVGFWRTGLRHGSGSSESALGAQPFRCKLAALRSARTARCALGESKAHAAILLTLLFDLCDANSADFSCHAHVRAPARLQVKTRNLDQSHATGPHRWLHRHGFDKTRVGFELGIGDPAAGDCRIARDHLGNLCGDRILVEAGFRNVEVETAFAVSD